MSMPNQTATCAAGAYNLVVDSSPVRKSVQLVQHMRDVITSSGAVHLMQSFVIKQSELNMQHAYTICALLSNCPVR